MHGIGTFFRNYFNSFIYALGITIGIFISIQELHKFNNVERFLVFSSLIFIILLLENIIAVLKRNKNVEINLDMNDSVNELWHFFYKFLLPFIYYLCLVAFGYFNLYSNSIYIILIFTFFTLLILFINTKAFFQNIKSMESRTHYVYDLIKFLIFFTSVNTFAHIVVNDESTLFLMTLATISLSFALTMLMVWRVNKLRIRSYFFAIAFSVILGFIFYALNVLGNFNPMQISLGLVFAFYLSVAIIHHALLNTLSKGVVLEYLIILLVVFTVVYGIS